MGGVVTQVARHPAVRRLLSRLRNESRLEDLVQNGLELGAGVQIASGTWIDPGRPWLISIGDGAVLAPGVMIFAHDAGMRLHLDVTRMAQVRIGARTYIGAGAIVLPGVTVGDGAVVAAGSIVSHDVEPHTVVAGNPAHPIATVDELVARHRDQMERSVVYPSDGWSLGSISPDGRAQQRHDTDGASAYVEARVRMTDRPPVPDRRAPEDP